MYWAWLACVVHPLDRARSRQSFQKWMASSTVGSSNLNVATMIIPRTVDAKNAPPDQKVEWGGFALGGAIRGCRRRRVRW